MNSGKQTAYRSYLLRLWLAKEQDQTVWRASLENPHTGERLGFATLERLFAFLEDQTTAVVTRGGEPEQGSGHS